MKQIVPPPRCPECGSPLRHREVDLERTVDGGTGVSAVPITDKCDNGHEIHGIELVDTALLPPRDLPPS